MTSRQTMITIGVALAAFVIAFVAGKAGGGSSEASAAPVGKALSAPAAVKVTSGVTPEAVPALKVIKKTKPKQAAPKSTTPSSRTPSSPTPSSPTPVPTTAPSNPTPTNPTPSNPTPSNPTPAPTPVRGGET